MGTRARVVGLLLSLILTTAGVAVTGAGASAEDTVDETPTTAPTTTPTEPPTTAPTTVPTTTPTEPPTTAPTTVPSTTPTTLPAATTTSTTAPPVKPSRSAPAARALSGIESHATKTLTISKVAPSGSFTFRVQRCTTGICLFGDSGWTTIASPTVAGGGSTVVSIPADDSYRVQEMSPGSPGAPSGWILTSAGCTGSSTAVTAGRRLTINDSNAAPTCTFTNVALAPSVTVAKASGTPSRSFDIAVQKCSAPFLGFCFGSWTTVSGGSLNLANDGAGSTVSLSELGLYRAIEPVPEGWRLVDVSCSGGSSTQEPLIGFFTGRTFELTAESQTRSCTFTNSDNHVTITKATTPAGATQAFDVDFETCTTNILLTCVGSWTPVAGSPSSLTDGASASFNELDGSLFDRLYRVSESTLPAGWTLEDVSCSGPGVLVDNNEDHALILFRVLNANEAANATCTVTNSTEASSITIDQVTDPDPSTEVFPFTAAGGAGVTASFGLSTSSTASVTFPDLPPNEYSFTEDLAGFDGWVLDNLSCTGGSNVTIVGPTATIALSPGENVVCTYTTVLEGSIEVAKVTDPSGGSGFDFTFENLDAQSGAQAFTLDDAGSQVFGDLLPTGDGSGYEIVETALPADWTLDGIDCGAASVTPVTDGVIVDLGGGQAVVCTFANASALAPALTVTKEADVVTASPGDTITYEYTVENTGPVRVTGVSLVDDPLGAVPLDDADGILDPGERTTGSRTYEVTEADAGTTIVNTAVATGTVPCGAPGDACPVASADAASLEVGASADRGTREIESDPVEASVQVAAVSPVVVVNPGTGVADVVTRSAGQLPFTGGIGPWIFGALAVLAGCALALLGRRRRTGGLTA
jgi:uncharacterized repeat protein (TIGR01451 family)